jgi:hypothetical protein
MGQIKKEYFRIPRKFPENFYFRFTPLLPYKGFYPPKSRFSLKNSGKISLRALTPLYRYRKTPILRGDVGGGPTGGSPYTPIWWGGLPINIHPVHGEP